MASSRPAKEVGREWHVKGEPSLRSSASFLPAGPPPPVLSDATPLAYLHREVSYLVYRIARLPACVEYNTIISDLSSAFLFVLAVER